MNNKLNIWFLNHYATQMYKDSGGRHYYFAKELIKRGFMTTIFCASTFHNSREKIDIEKDRYVVKNRDKILFVFVKVHSSLKNNISRVFNMMEFYFNVKHVGIRYGKQNQKPDVILASSVHPLTLVAGIKLAKKFKCPCICEIRDLWPEAIFKFTNIKEKSLLGKILIKGEYWIYRKADALIFTKEGDHDYLNEKKWTINQGGKIDTKKVFYINNGIDIEGFKKSSKENIINDEDLINNKFNIVYTGAIRPVNNVGKILDVAKALKYIEDMNFLIYGDGNEKKTLENRIKNENINNVKIKGRVEKKYIPYILSKSNINILNYSRDKYNWSRGNSSNKLFEYMASGKPIISTVQMGYSIINRYKCGIELKDDSVETFSNEILKIKNMKDEEYVAMGENGIIGAADFDYKILTNKLIKVINNVIKEKR